jgi:hypothetical protein
MTASSRRRRSALRPQTRQQFTVRETARQKVTYWSADGDRDVDRPEAPRQIRELNQAVDASLMAEQKAKRRSGKGNEDEAAN